MNVKSLIGLWEDHAQGTLTQESYQIKLTLEDAARIEALSEMYPRRSKEQLVSELLSASLSELEGSFPYRQGSEITSTDEFGDPIYKDVGPTPHFLTLTRKHLARYRDVRKKEENDDHISLA